MEKGEKYLPIGTVVMLKGGSKRVMITGFYVIEEGKEDTAWDYSGCLYPEGLLQSNEVCLFDHAQIKEVYHIGLIDEEEKEFKKNLEQFINQLDNMKKEETNKNNETEA